MTLENEIKEIRKYTERHPELYQRAHHFLYDLKFNPKDTGCFVVMGINPGETDDDRNKWPAPTPTEETSLRDFHKNKPDGSPQEKGREGLPWTKAMERILGKENIVQTQLFFWSSSDIKELEGRYGILKNNKHLKFCKDMNLRLFDKYKPKAIIFPGIGHMRTVIREYDLKPTENISLKEGNHRLLEHYTDGTRPWIFTKHWTGSHGFSDFQKEQIKERIKQIAQIE